MRPHTPVSAACWTCLVFASVTTNVHAQGTPISTKDQKILASDGVTGDQRGAVGTSAIWDDLLIIGAPWVDGPGGVDSGTAYIFRYDGSAWIEDAKSR